MDRTMRRFTRREALKTAAMVPAWNALQSKIKSAGIRIADLQFDFEDFKYRTPLKFGGTVVDRVTLLNVTCAISTAAGKKASGFASMPLGNVWAFPSSVMGYETTLNAMKVLTRHIAEVTAAFKEIGHPIDINCALEPQYLKAAETVSAELGLPSPIPKLCTQVTASPFDAAVHDAFGKLHGTSSYLTYGRELLPRDLSHYLGPDFRGRYLDEFVLKSPKPQMPLYHLVGAVDPILEEDIQSPIGDGLPETLPDWIRHDGLTHIKIKLNGDDLTWDVERVVRVDRVTSEVQKSRGVTKWFYSLDFNEKCRNVEYLLEFMNRVKNQTPDGFQRVQYIEQPTKRDLKSDRTNVMHEASKLRPVVIDESLTDLESLLLAREMGYTGAALKACKGQSQALLMAAAGQKYRLFLCVQDLTCPGASLIHSAGLAAHIPGVAAIEANARQYVPAANQSWESRFPGLFRITDGTMKTAVLNRPGLGAV
jgi:L-alanine-DL-glutamate epimerase-like enolase superfamily enzyme